MRSLLALIIVLSALDIALPEGDFFSLIGDNTALVDLSARATSGNPLTSLVEIEPSIGKADRIDAVSRLQRAKKPLPELASLEAPPASALLTAVDPDQSPELADIESPPDPASLDGEIDPSLPPPAAAIPAETDSGAQPELSLNDLCSALLTSAVANNLPVAFFANLIWQESRLRDDAVSRVGALGIAQFMPAVALETGLDDPFDPRQAIPASARLLRELRQRFGNLGFVAAAYNAGAHRVSEWLEHGRTLPRQTRDYVRRVTGRSAEDWRKAPPGDAVLTFAQRLPCRGLPAYADLEHAQWQEVQLEKADAPPVRPEPQPIVQSHPAQSSAHSGRRHFAYRTRQASHGRHDTIRSAARDRGRREGDRFSHAAHLKSRHLHGRKSIEVG